MSVLYDDVKMDQINSQKYNSLEMYVVTINISMTKHHHHLINRIVPMAYSNITVYEGN